MKQTKQLKKPVEILLLILWAIASFFIPQFIIGVPMLLICGSDFFHSSLGTTIYNILFYIATIFLVTYVPKKIFNLWETSRKKLGLTGLPTWTDIGLAVVGFLAYLILAGIVLNFASNFIDISQEQELGFDTLVFGFDRILTFLSLVIIAPIAEEIFFRGWLYGKLREKITGKFSIFFSVLIVSLIFGLFHGQLNVAINVFVMSIVMCLMRELTGTIYGSILLHIIKNAVAFYIVYIML